MDIADKINFLRLNIMKLSKSEFAKKLNVSRITVYNWENGIMIPSTEHIKKISLLCNVTPDYLINDNEQYQLNPLGLDEEGYKTLKQLIQFL